MRPVRGFALLLSAWALQACLPPHPCDTSNGQTPAEDCLIGGEGTDANPDDTDKSETDDTLVSDTEPGTDTDPDTDVVETDTDAGDTDPDTDAVETDTDDDTDTDVGDTDEDTDAGDTDEDTDAADTDAADTDEDTDAADTDEDTDAADTDAADTDEDTDAADTDAGETDATDTDGLDTDAGDTDTGLDTGDTDAPCPDTNTQPIRWYLDDDGDGFGDENDAGIFACDPPSADHVGDNTDCDDADPDRRPDAAELCDTRDNDCDGLIDDDDDSLQLTSATTRYRDVDQDGFGDTASLTTCVLTPPYTADNDADCDDNEATTHPLAIDWTGDNTDNNCDDWTDINDLRFPAAKLLGATDDQAGRALTSAGDINGDGLDDLLIGVHLHDAGAAGNNEGAAYLFYSPVLGTVDLDAADAIFEGGTTSAWAGRSVAGIGDVNNDGFDDFAVGESLGEGRNSQGITTTNGGVVYVFHGGEDAAAPAGLLLPSDAAATFLGSADNANLGAAMVSAGDLDGDDFDDLIVSATGQPRDDNGSLLLTAGAAFVIYGPVTGDEVLDPDNLPANAAAFLGLEQADQLGTGLAGGGHLDLDGYPELLFGAHQQSSIATRAGAAYLFRGTASRWSGARLVDTADAVIRGGQIGSNVGRSLDFIGDQTGDDLDHPLVTQHGYNIPAGNDAGRVLIFESDISGVVNVPTISGQTIIASDRVDDELGYDAVGVGDVNNDGWEDIVLTANGHDPPGGFDVGAAYLFLGPVWGDYDQADADAVFYGEANFDGLGNSASPAGDVNGDGHADFLLGANFNDRTGPFQDSGAVYLLHGSAQP